MNQPDKKFNKLTNSHYWTYGQSSQPVIIMLHGFRGTHHGLELIAKKLPDYYIIMPDIPGFGDTAPLSNEHNLVNYTAWLDDFIANLKLSSPPIIIGHSFGSIITANYASQNPNKLSRLILINPIGSPALEGSKAFLTQLAILYYWIGRKLPTRLAYRWLSNKSIVMVMSTTMAKTKDKVLRRFIHDQHLRYFSNFANSKVVSEAFKTSISHNVRDVANEIIVPTLLIAGDIDEVTTLDKQKELVRLLPNGDLKIINQVGHLTHYETPDKVAELIQEFINPE